MWDYVLEVFNILKDESSKLIFGGFFFIVVMSLLVFFGMNRYMERSTKDDVRQVAQSYVEGVVIAKPVDIDNLKKMLVNYTRK